MANMALAFDILARDRASKTFDRVGSAADRTSKKVGGFHKAAIAGAAIAGAAIIKFGKDSVSAFVDAERQSAQLDLALQKFPKTADVTRSSFDKLNAAIQRKTGVDDDALASGQAVLAQFNLTGKQIQGLTPLLADYATKTGKDLPSAATDLGRAFMGNTRALKALGINYKSTGDAAKDQAAIQQLLQQKIGGTAEAMGRTASGKAKILNAQFGDLQEKVGEKLVPALIKAANVGLKVVDWIEKNQNVLVPLVATVGTIIGLVKAWAAAQVVLNFVLTANPIGLVVIAIAGLVAGLVVAYKKSETFRNIVNGVFKAVAVAVKGMWNVVRPILQFLVKAWFTVVGALVNGAAKAFGWVPGIGGKLKEAARKFNAFRDDVNRALDGVHKKVNIRVQAIANLQAVGASTAAVRNDPDYRAVGGRVLAGRSYVVGEYEPERFVPDRSGTILNQRQIAAAEGTGGPTINIGQITNVKPEQNLSVVDQLRQSLWLKGFTS